MTKNNYTSEAAIHSSNDHATMQYGHFDDLNREYVITTPETPSPWINYLGCEKFFSLFSHTGGGYCFYRDARLRRLLRYRYNSIPLDGNGRYFFLRDEASGDYWSLGYMPVKKPVEEFECRHGLGYSKVRSRRSGIESELLAFVPLGHNAEILRVRLTNESDTSRWLKLFSYVEFCLWNALDDMTNYQRNLSTGEVEVEGSTLYHKTEYRERRDHYAFYHVNHPIVGFDTQRDAFVGPYNGLHEPAAVCEGKSSNSVASGWSPIASHCLELELQPSESLELVFVLGYIENPADQKWERPGVVRKQRAHELIEAFSTSKQVDNALVELRNYWQEMLAKFQIDSSDRRLDRMVNIWNAYQCMVTFNLSRSASYYESGIGRGMGFRDCNQDLLGIVHMVPERARERILDIAATQFANGSAYHQYQPLTKRGNADIGDGFNDDPLWLILGVADYVKETGDYAILEEQVPFDNDPDNTASLQEHLRRSFYHVVEHLGPHGLPLIGRADWNDCLNLNCFSTNPDESFQTTGNSDGPNAESVMIAGMFVFIGEEYVALLEYLHLPDEARQAGVHIQQMRAAVLEHAFDGQWFLRAYDHHGQKVGSHENQDGQIFIESQGFCSMAKIGEEDGLCTTALDSVEKRLAGPFGIKLLDPPYADYHVELGEVSSYPPGYKENAGIFCHNNPWIVIAEALLGRGDKAYDYYKRTAPAFLDHVHQLHRTEPYVYSQMIASPDAQHSGQAKNSWLTGTASWNYVAITQYLLGIKPEHEGLRVNPTIASEIGNFTIQRRCRGAIYELSVFEESPQVDPGLYINGERHAGVLIPYFPEGEEVQVDFVYAVSKPEEAVTSKD